MASTKKSKKVIRGSVSKVSSSTKAAPAAKIKAKSAVSKSNVVKSAAPAKKAAPAATATKSANSRASVVKSAAKAPAKSHAPVSKSVAAAKPAARPAMIDPMTKAKQMQPAAKPLAVKLAAAKAAIAKPAAGKPAAAKSAAAKPAAAKPTAAKPAAAKAPAKSAAKAAAPAPVYVPRVIAPKPGVNRSLAEKIAAVRAAEAKAAIIAAQPKPVSTAPTAMSAPIPGPRMAGPNGQRPMGGFASTRPGLPPHLAINVKAMPKPGGGKHHGFKAGEFIVYPSHGVGQISAIEEQEVAGFKLELFVINFAKDKMTLKVPAPKVANGAIRKLADAALVQKALDTLTGRARIKRTMWSRRAQEYEAKINSGDLIAIAEVVRDLYRSDAQPEQSYSERQLYEAALDRMGREIASVQKLTETEAAKVIDGQLQKGPRRGVRTEAEVEADAEPDGAVEEAA